MKRVLFVASFPPPLTGEAVCTRYNFEMVQTLCEVDAVDISHGRSLPRRVGTFSFGRIFQLLRCYHGISQKLRQFKWDIVYFVPGASLFGQLKDWLLLTLVARHPVEVVCHVHNGDFSSVFKRPIVGRISVRCFERVSRFLFLSENMSERMCRYVPAGKRFVVRNAIDESLQFSPKQVDARLAKRAYRRNWCILYISNMIPEKGFLDLAEALTRLPKFCSLLFEAHFIGSFRTNLERSRFEASIAERGLSGQVRVHGGISDRMILREFLEKADVVVLPTYYSREAQPMCLIEAANAGIPLISTPHAGIPEIVVDGKNGILVPPRDPESLCQALTAVCSAQNWERFARASREVFESKFSAERRTSNFKSALFGI